MICLSIFIYTLIKFWSFNTVELHRSDRERYSFMGAGEKICDFSGISNTFMLDHDISHFKGIKNQHFAK